MHNAKIPREYLVPDLIKIGMIVRAVKDKAGIPRAGLYAKQDVAAAREGTGK